MKTNLISKAGIAAFIALAAATGATAPSLLSVSAEEELPAAAETQAVEESETVTEKTETVEVSDENAETKCSCMTTIDEDGNIVTNEINGDCTVTTDVDENGNEVYKYTFICCTSDGDDGEVKVFREGNDKNITDPGELEKVFKIDLDSADADGEISKIVFSSDESDDANNFVYDFNDKDFEEKLSKEEYEEYKKIVERLEELDAQVFSGDLSESAVEERSKEVDPEREKLFNRLSELMVKMSENTAAE